MEELRRLLEERHRHLLYELEKIREIMDAVDAAAVAGPEGLSSWRWAEVGDLVHKISTRSVDTAGTFSEREAVSNALDATIGGAVEVKVRGRAKAQGNPKPALIINKIREILLTNSRPMSRSELLEELKERKIFIDGYDPLKVLGTNLWRSRKDIVNIKGHGYWLRDRAYTPAGYLPSDVLQDELD